MRIQHLKLTAFRNVAAASVAVPPGAQVVALVGENGSGKTSVLEAVSLLTPTRGLLGAEGKSQLRHGSKEWGLWARLEGGDEIGQVHRGGQRILHLNGNRENLEQLGHVGSVAWLTPATDFLFSGPPAQRRRWLDDLTAVLLPAHATAVQRFRQHRQARLKLLQTRLTGDWLEAEEKLAAEWGLQVLRHRAEYLRRLAPHLQGLTLTLAGQALHVLEAENPVLALKGKFERSREVDARLQRTHAGPNTLDVEGSLALEGGGQVALARASSGQHKRGLIVWLLGHVALLRAARGAAPLVLIDEFSAHLDAQRRALLLQTLLQVGCQVWLTDTEAPPPQAGLHCVPVAAGVVG